MSYDPDEMMLELFRAEVESHSDSLTNSLLKLEQEPAATDVLDGMMRAAHSIKGAARIVRVDAAVDVAHVMEDCFVAAQRGELILESNGIDVLLRSVDLLVQISEASKDPNVDWTSFDATLKTTVEQLRCVLNQQPIPDTSLPAASIRTIGSVPAPTSVQASPAPISEVTSIESSKAAAQSLVMPKELVADNAESLRVQLIGLLEQHASVTLDLRQLQDLDAVGLAWLHSASKYASFKACQLKIANASPVIGPVLDLVGLTGPREA